ncbi:MAG: YvcK family protein, partial [Candidatus Omnitrophica bacterium]|nr:YvcK family protein [Candidatus Omnitrophota bacterium]
MKNDIRKLLTATFFCLLIIPTLVINLNRAVVSSGEVLVHWHDKDRFFPQEVSRRVKDLSLDEAEVKAQLSKKFGTKANDAWEEIQRLLPELQRLGISPRQTVPAVIEIANNVDEFKSYLKAVATDNFRRLAQISQAVFKKNQGDTVKLIYAETQKRATEIEKKFGSDVKDRFVDLGLGLTFDSAVKGVDFRNPQYLAKVLQAIAQINSRSPPKVVAFGGGGGFVNVTLQVVQKAFDRVLAVEPGTDNGGGTGNMQEQVKGILGYIFGVGDTANLMVESLPRDVELGNADFGGQGTERDFKDMIVSWRPGAGDVVNSNLVDTHTNYIINKFSNPKNSGAKNLPDLFFFLANQLNLDRQIDEFNQQFGNRVKIPGQSIRNLNFLSAYYGTNAFLKGGNFNPEMAKAAMFVLEKMYGVRLNGNGDSLVHPTISAYGAAVSYVVYKDRLTSKQIEYIKKKDDLRLNPDKADSEDEKKKREWQLKYLNGEVTADELTLKGIPLPPIQYIKDDQGNEYTVAFGQKFIDQIFHNSKVVDFGLVKEIPTRAVGTLAELDTLDMKNVAQLPATQELIDALGDPNVQLVTVGAGSLFSSLLCQLAVPGVAEAFIKRPGIKK